MINNVHTLYSITCLVNSRVYIGVTSMSLGMRYSNHKSRLKKGAHLNRHLQKDFSEYGEDSFVVDEINKGAKEEMYRLERFLTLCVTGTETESCYNIVPGGDLQGVYCNALLQKRRRDNPEKYKDSGKKILQARLRNCGGKIVFSEETRQKMSRGASNRITAESTREKLRLKVGGKNNNAKKILDTSTGVIYPSLKDAAKAISMNYCSLRMRLSGRYRNDTNLIKLKKDAA